MFRLIPEHAKSYMTYNKTRNFRFYTAPPDRADRIRNIAKMIRSVMTEAEYMQLLKELDRLKPEEKDMDRPPD